MKQTHAFLAILLFAFFAQASHGQTPLPWKTIHTIPGKVLAFTHHDNVLYAYATAGIYSSKDYGSHWTWVREMPIKKNLSVLAFNDSVAVISDWKSVYGGYHHYKGGLVYLFIGGNYRGGGTNSTGYFGSNHGGISYVDSVTYRLLNDGAISRLAYDKQSSNYYSILDAITTFRLKGNGACLLDTLQSTTFSMMNGTTAFSMPYKLQIEKIIGVNGDEMYSIYQDSLYTFNQDLEIIDEHPLPFQTGEKYVQYANGSFYVIKSDGQTYISSDGENWTLGNSGIDSIYHYQYQSGLHIIRTTNNVYLSHDFESFTVFSSIGPKPNFFSVNGNFVIAATDNPGTFYRSFNLGNTWEVFSPQSSVPAKVLNVLDVDGHLVVVSPSSVYKQVCQDSFAYSAEYEEIISDSTVQLPNGMLVEKGFSSVKYLDVNTNQWITLYDFQEKIAFMGAQDNELLVWHGNQLDVLSDDGQVVHTFNQFTAPNYSVSYTYNKGIDELYYSNDTLLVNELLYRIDYDTYYVHSSYSTNGGQEWSNIPGFTSYWSADIFRHGGLFYMKDGNDLYGFSDLSEEPSIVANIPEDAQAFSNAVSSGSLVVEPDGHDFLLWDDNQFYSFARMPGEQLYLQQSTRQLWSFSKDGGLFRTEVAYLDSTVLDTLPTTVSTACSLPSGYYLAADSACGDDKVMDVEKVWIDSTLVVYKCQDLSIPSIYAECYESPGQKMIAFGENGACDTMISLQFITIPLIKDTIFEASVCAWDSITFQGQAYEAGVHYLDTISSLVYGCDSVVSVVVIRTKTVKTVLLHGTLSCSKDKFSYNNHLYEEGFYFHVDTISDLTGCDSVVYNLKVEIVGSVCRPVGTVFYDVNENGIQDNGEAGAINYPVFIESWGVDTYTNGYGYYYLYASDTTYVYTAQVSPPSGWKLTTDSVQIFNPLPAVNQGHDFGLALDPVGLLEVDESSLVITPNPASTLMQVQIKSGRSIKKVTMYNQLGQLRLSSTKSVLDVSQLPTGPYIVKVETDKKSFIQHVIIER